MEGSFAFLPVQLQALLVTPMVQEQSISTEQCLEPFGFSQLFWELVNQVSMKVHMNVPISHNLPEANVL